MPIPLAPASGVHFLPGWAVRQFWACAWEGRGAEVDSDWIAILNDTDIGVNHGDGAPIPSHLREAVAWLAKSGSAARVISASQRCH